MDSDDEEEKTAFYTSQGVMSIAIQKMPFGSKDCGATYQRMVDNAFEEQSGPQPGSYVDDLCYKCNTESVTEDGRLPVGLQQHEEAFTQLKLLFAALPKLVALRTGEDVDYCIYPQMHGAISAVLLTDSGLRINTLGITIKLVIVAVVWVVPRGGPIAVKTRSYGALALPEACLEICLEAWSLCFFACGVRWVKFPCFVILDFGSVLSVGSHGWRQSVDTKVGRSLIRFCPAEVRGSKTLIFYLANSRHLRVDTVRRPWEKLIEKEHAMSELYPIVSDLNVIKLYNNRLLSLQYFMILYPSNVLEAGCGTGKEPLRWTSLKRRPTHLKFTDVGLLPSMVEFEDSDAEASFVADTQSGTTDGGTAVIAGSKTEVSYSAASMQTLGNNPTENHSLANILHSSMMIQSNKIVRRDGRVQSYYGLRITGIPTSNPGADVSYHTLGPPSYECSNWHATMWYKERSNKEMKAVNPSFSLCYQNGDSTFRINGQNYHRIGSLLLKKGVQPRFAQLWFFDTENEVRNHIVDFIDNENYEGVDKTTVQSLLQMLDQYSTLAKAFRMARDWCRSHTSVNVELKLLSDKTNAR
ncbi:hypothetical protein Tco_1369274 [Tanacetum coccineum]